MQPFPSPCPVCFRTLTARLEPRGGEVWLRKACPEHGAFGGRYWDSAEHLAWTDGFAGDGAACCPPGPVADAAAPPRLAGSAAAPAQAQAQAPVPAKRCVAVVDVTRRCNLACAFCFATSHPGLPEAPRDEALALLATVRREAGPVPVQLSGGEPTTRDDLPELVRAARALGLPHVMVNTNGLRLGQPGYARELREAGVAAVYLQFDGLTDAVYERIRGAPLLRAKHRAIEACREAGLKVVLVPTVVRGVNDHEVGAVVDFALERLDVVRGVVFQPMARFGRWAHDDGHLSVAGVARLLAGQTGYLRERELFPFPCCSPRCAAATLLFKAPGGPVPATRYVGPELYQRIMAAVGERNYLDVLAGTDDGALAALGAACGCGVAMPAAARALLARSLVVSVQGFMDADTCDLSRLGSCCIQVPTPAGTMAPFCGWNLTDRSGAYALRRRYLGPGVVLRA